MKHLVTGFLLAALLMGAGVASAQDEDAEPQAVQVRPGLTVTDQDAMAGYVIETHVNEHGSFAGIEAWVLDADDGWVQLTRCDNLVVRCEPVTVRMEGVAQGAGFALVAESR